MPVGLSASSCTPGGWVASVVTCRGLNRSAALSTSGPLVADLEEDDSDDMDMDEESNGSSDEEFEDDEDDDFDEDFDEDFEDLEYDLEEMGDDDVEKLNGKSCGIELDD